MQSSPVGINIKMNVLLSIMCLGLLTSSVTCYMGYGRGYGRRMSWYDPYSAVCKSGFYLKNPYTRQPFFCDGHWRRCPWGRWFKCESMTGSDDGWGVCCFDRGDV